MAATPAQTEQQLPTQCASVPPDPGQHPEGIRGWRRVLVWVLLFLCACGVLGCIAYMAYVYWSGQDEYKQPRYHVAVDAVTGLDSATDLGWETLDPEFNLTVGLASQSVTMGWCFYGGSTVRVSYRDVPLAHGALPELCVGPRRAGQQGSVVAWGNAVPVPRMARDLRRCAAEFDVALTVATAPHAVSWVVVSCRAKVSQSAVPQADVGPVSYGRSPPTACA